MAEVELEYDEHALRVLKAELAQRNTYMWRQADNTLINVKDMSDTHLRNTIRKLEDYLHEREIVLGNYVDAMDYYD